ncbi:DNA repair protein xrcc4 [Entophlyctis luteolus]|nr:DNA repair protein xrcc4 [Entophlyctis luteolus]
MALSPSNPMLLALPGHVLHSAYDDMAGALTVTALASAESRAWYGAVSHRDIQDAAARAGYADDAFEDFALLLRRALSGMIDQNGRQTECVVIANKGNQNKRLDVKVFPTDAQDIEFEIISIPLEVHGEPYHQVSNELLTELISTQSKSIATISKLQTEIGIMHRDLTRARESFREWVEDKKESYELEIFAKFVSVLNAKKLKIRQLMEALEVYESNAKPEPTTKMKTEVPKVKGRGIKRERSASPTLKYSATIALSSNPSFAARGRIAAKSEDGEDDEDDDPPPILLKNKKG